MSDDLFPLPPAHVGEVTRRGLAAGRPPPHFGAPRKPAVTKAKRHVAAPHDWRGKHGDAPANDRDAKALQKAFRAACELDAEAALAVLERHGVASFADVKRAHVNNVHFDLVMLTFYPTDATR